jgi:hypothetical protein
MLISGTHVRTGTAAALEEWQESIRSAYRTATQSNQPDHIYREVLLAYALAKKDEARYFTAASVRSPLQTITARNYDIPNYAQHLKKLSEPGRGRALNRTGETRRLRYRFDNPMMHAYVILKGVVDGLLEDNVL